MMRIKVVILLSFFLFLIGCEKNGVEQSRRNKLIESLKSKDYSVRLRTIQELGLIVEDDLVVQKALIQHIYSSDVNSLDIDPISEIYVIARIFKKIKEPLISDLVQAYKNSSKSEDDFKKLLMILGRIGPKAKEAIPFLQEQPDKYENEAEIAGAIRVVLANLGYKYDDNISTILSDIKNRNERGRGEIEMMALAGAGQWVTNEIISELESRLFADNDIRKFLDEHGEEPAFAAVAIGSLGKKAMTSVNNLNSLLNYVRTEEYYFTCRIIFGLPLAKVEAGKSEENKALKEVLKYMGSEYFGNHTDFAALAWVDSLIDSQIIKETGNALENKDPEIIKGALWMLWWIGLDAQEYAPKVIEILKNSSDMETKAVAARAIGYIGSEKDIPQLEKILEKEEKDIFTFVSHQIKESISILRLEPTEK
jgi:HEAT repeat protein